MSAPEPTTGIRTSRRAAFPPWPDRFAIGELVALSVAAFLAAGMATLVVPVLATPALWPAFRRAFGAIVALMA